MPQNVNMWDTYLISEREKKIKNKNDSIKPIHIELVVIQNW